MRFPVGHVAKDPDVVGNEYPFSLRREVMNWEGRNWNQYVSIDGFRMKVGDLTKGPNVAV